MKTMQPIMTTKIEENENFLYEVKYDGFRAVIYWTTTKISIKSRKNIDLTSQFPEIIQACKDNTKSVQHLLPLQLDGELVILNNEYQGNFALIQKRGRLKNKEKIDVAAQLRPAQFIVFDLMAYQGNQNVNIALINRKQRLDDIFNYLSTTNIQLVSTFHSYNSIKKVIFEYKAEGVVAKRKSSLYIGGKQHHDWLKEKNWRTITGFLTDYNYENGYFQVSVYAEGKILPIGQCKHGLTGGEKDSLQKIFLSEGVKGKTIYTIPPAICAEIHTLDLHDGQLREPEFVKLLPQLEATTCTYEKLQLDLAMLPKNVTTSNEEKVFWPDKHLTKSNHLIYIRDIYPAMKPYINDRALTLIRCPDGVEEPCFFQKHLPSYAPDFFNKTEEKLILCDRLDTLIWLANHSAIEYHIPFQKVDSDFPDEIVFDLDPPSREDFSMAIEVAHLLKKVLDELALQTFIKTSGNKGLQIHMPIPIRSFSYEETGHFTESIAKIVEKAAPTLCTTERFKNKRQGRLYIDYVQHGKKKTIIAPYSPRNIGEAKVATPLFWDEVKEGLLPDQFTIQNVVERIQTKGFPWLHYEKARNQNLSKALPLFKQ